MKNFKGIWLFGFVLILILSCKEKETFDKTRPTVYIDETETGYRLIRNNKPFYIKGGAAHPNYLNELKTAGANAARIYDTVNLQKTLDKAHNLGLAVAVDIPLPSFRTEPEFYENDELFHQLKADVAEFVKEYKNHPALLYWNLGNEIYYPYLYERTKFYSNFNTLIELLHELDPNHPVSTVTIGANKLRVLSIITRSPKLDFISFNSFGTLSKFSKKLKPISIIWDGPHAITEWGVNGPWEARVTVWGSPIEETSTKKAEQIKERYYKYIAPMKDNSLGSFVFYWGKKNESTLTWFSLFGENGLKTQAVFEMNKIWTGDTGAYPGPSLNYMLLNAKGAMEDIILPPNVHASAKVVDPISHNDKPLKYKWEVKYESWHVPGKSIFETNFQKNNTKISFKTPKHDGPYRLYVYITNDSGYVATANIPFYILTPENGK